MYSFSRLIVPQGTTSAVKGYFIYFAVLNWARLPDLSFIVDSLLLKIVLKEQMPLKRMCVYVPYFENKQGDPPPHLPSPPPLLEYSRLLQRLAAVDSRDCSSKMSFYTATLHRALQKKSSNDHLSLFNHGHSNCSLDHALDESETWPSVASNLNEKYPKLWLNYN